MAYRHHEPRREHRICKRYAVQQNQIPLSHLQPTQPPPPGRPDCVWLMSHQTTPLLVAMARCSFLFCASLESRRLKLSRAGRPRRLHANCQLIPAGRRQLFTRRRNRAASQAGWPLGFPAHHRAVLFGRGPLSLILALSQPALRERCFAHQVIKPREAQPLLLRGAPCLPLR